MHGVKLTELGISDMLDVLHYFFEEDTLSSSTAEHAEAKDAVRNSVYTTMYETVYKYGAKKSSQSGISELDYPLDDEPPVPIDPFAKSNSVKPFTPATDFDPNSSKPFGRVLDAPLG